MKIRLKRLGKIRSPHYRIIVIDSRAKRDGRAIEELGVYQPKNDPSVIRVDSERVRYWLGVGAQPSDAVRALLRRTGDWQAHTGEDSPSGVLEQPAPFDREAFFAKALAEADGESEATPKKSRRSQPKAEAEADAVAETEEAQA